MSEITNDMLRHIWSQCIAQEHVDRMDDRELLWHLMRQPFWAEIEMGSFLDCLTNTLSNRLYPEFDGDKVRFMPWGWQTLEGEVRYTKEIIR